MPVVEDEKELQHQALTVVDRSKMVRVVDQVSYDEAADLLTRGIKPMRSRWAEYWSPLRDAAHKSWKGILDKFNEVDQPLEAAEKQVKAEISRWDQEQAHIQAERQRQAQLEAERKDRERRLAEAVEAEEAGAPEETVASILNITPVVVAPVVEPTYQRASGITRRSNWKAKVTDFHALVKAAAKDKSLLAYLQPNETALNNRAKADKTTLSIPGVAAWDDSIVSGRSR